MIQNKYKVVIIDDEPDSVEIIEALINEKSDEFEVVACSSDPLEGIKYIINHKPDILFLDIEMPQISGFKLLEIIGDFSFQLIFITAFEQYAVKAFKSKALDYILKPISADEVFKSLARAVEIIKKQSLNSDNLTENYKENKRLVVPTNSGYEFVKTDDIVKMEADGSYTKIFILNQPSILVSKTLKELESIINSEMFFRTHRSYVVNLRYLIKYEKGVSKLIMNDNTSVPISRSNITSFKEMLSKNSVYIKLS